MHAPVKWYGELTLDGHLPSDEGSCWLLSESVSHHQIARALIDQPVHRVLVIGAAPLHQTGPTTAGNLFNAGDGTPFTRESHRLIAGLRVGPSLRKA
jgi:hypothetical protein